MKRFCTFSMIGAWVLVAGMAQAQNKLGNPGFETVPAGGAGDWNTFAGGDVPGSVSQHSTLDPRSGTGHMDLQTAGHNTFAGMFQFGSVTFPPDVNAEVTFTGWHKSLLPFNGTRELKIEWAGAPQLRVDSLEIGSEWEQFSLVGIAPPGVSAATITYAISSFNDGGGENNVYVDDFSATATPEPTSVMLGLIGLLGLVGLVRRR